ncbi:hypothetical protein AVEN_12449-2 [Araneus ventricosus]|uniref:G domain-containing protein n=2 Tax=Araneus ventricosus TaxID=182803 RepID=A0A4Y2MWB2_ARAVE|nr:hypothetical protein AVEN_12449-2 [Araneus ventricosus]
MIEATPHHLLDCVALEYDDLLKRPDFVLETLNSSNTEYDSERRKRGDLTKGHREIQWMVLLIHNPKVPVFGEKWSWSMKASVAATGGLPHGNCTTISWCYPWRKCRGWEIPEPVTTSPCWAPWWVGGHRDENINTSNMAPSLISRPGGGLNLPNSNDASAQNADAEKSDQLIKDTFDLLERGEKEIKFDEKHKDVILILGNTGSGKSTFTQWVAGDNTKLISRETREGTGEYIIVDHNRIGHNTLKSKTVFPELVVDAKTNAAYYDCPGFRDTRTSHDIAGTYFIKRVIDYSTSVKMIFTISHHSVRKGVDRQDFMKLVRHVTDFVKDIEKFKHSIAIVATKVDNQYIKQGKSFVLVEDEKVIAAISDFLQEAKQYLEDNSKSPKLSGKENQFYENAIKFVDVLLEKDGESYPKIGLFRRPDEPGPISDIPLLQKGKEDIERIIYEKLDFTAKNNEDFGYTVSETTKIDIIEIVDEINKNLWSRISNIAENMQEYYQNLFEQVRCKMQLFLTETDVIDVNSSEAEAFARIFSSGYSITSDLVNKTMNITNPEELAEIVKSAVSNLEINISKDDVLYIANQGKYFSFLQTVSDNILSSKPWDKLFKDVETFLSGTKTLILHDVYSAAEKVNNRIQINLDAAVKAMQEEYAGNIKSLEIQKLPEKLNKDSRIIFQSTEEMKNGTTTEKLVNAIQYVADNLGVSLPKENLQHVTNQGKYLKFLNVIGDETLDAEPIKWLTPFRNIAKYFDESIKWYTFLEDMHNKFSQYDIQKDRQMYNVADLEDWGQLGKPQGISVSSINFEKFLNKIEDYNVTEYETIRNLTTTGLQIEELNQVLSSTLKHRPTVRCLEPNIIIKGNYISLNEIMQNIMRNSDTDNSCKNFKDQLDSGKYNMFKVFALNKVFFDTDLTLAGKGISVVVISPKWEVIGSRIIELNGADAAPHAKSKAKNGAHPGSNGMNGAPGKPGRSGETFFGIGTTFVNGANLKISSNGGKGGRGQDGGDGATGVPGRNAETPSASDPPCENGYVGGFKCEEIKKKNRGGFILFAVVVFTDGTSTEKSFRIFGLPGGRGGNGGDGGKEGRGGYLGNISILELNGPSDITKVATMGKEGEIGEAGAGSAQGGKNGNDIIADWYFWRPNGISFLLGRRPYKEWKWKVTINTNGTGPAGKFGKNGANAAGLQNPVPANGIRKLSNIINEYKTYLRENLNDRFNKHSLSQFLDQLNSRNDVKKLYDTLGLIDEFRGLEEQFHKLSDQIDFSSFYSSLKQRINDFAKSYKDDTNSRENKKVLNYLYTATLGRIYNLKENSESNLIIDIRGYLDLIKENIKPLKDLQMTNNKADVIYKYKENYKRGIDKKIEEATTFIVKQINPEIENVSMQIDNQVNYLIDETIALQKKAEKEREELVKKKKELEYALAIKGLFSCFQIIGRVVSFLGPIGAIAGTVIEATSTVGESLALNNQHQTLNLPSDIVSAIATIGDQIKTTRNQKVAHLTKLLDEISEEIKKNPEDLNDIQGKISDIKDKLEKVGENKDFKQVKMIESELKRELERKGEDLKVHSTDEKSLNAWKVVGKIYQISQFGSLLLDTYDKIKGDKEKVDVITDAIEKIEDEMKQLREYEEGIYDTIVPMLQEMENNMIVISDKLEDKSQVTLDVTKWKVQSTLKDMRLQIQRLTEGFEVKDDISRCIEKLDEVMTTLINIYDRIQSFQDQQNLANYIADISSVAASSISIRNQQLVNAINHLEWAIRSNIVLKQYKSAVDAFKQWVFPLVDHYIETPMLPSQLQLDTNIQDLVQNAMREIETIKQKLALYNTSVKNSDQYLQSAEFSSRYVSSQPFFVWKNEEYGGIISNLLAGKKVILKADVKNSVPHKDAIKFSVINFYFRTKNETAQSLLSETLKGFDIRATHIGNSYYRYADKIFLITSDSVPISYSCETNDAGVPIRSNTVYSKLKSGDLLLSPYTLWEVKMINTTNKYSFHDLESYKNEIDLELSGFGSYVDANVFKVAAGAYKSFMVNNNTNLAALKTSVNKATDVNGCTTSNYRLTRSLDKFVVNSDYMTNGAAAGISSPINLLYNFLKTYFVSNVIITMNQIFDREQISVRNNDNCSELPEERVETRNTDQTVASNPAVTNTVKVESISNEDNLGLNKETTGQKSENTFIIHFDYRNSCSKSLLLSDQKDRGNNQLIQVPELNCSLLLADLVIRTITGNRYKSGIDECLLSPRDVVLRKITNGAVRGESEVKQKLQRLLSEKEDRERKSWFSKLNDYVTSTLQLLGLSRNEDTDEYVLDIRKLFT